MTNSKKYSISAMCKVLKISRSQIYYNPAKKESDEKLEEKIVNIFKKSRNNYGTRKIKIELAKTGIIISRRKIARIMKKLCLVSNYTTKQFKVHSNGCNEDKIANVLNRDFNRDQKMDVIVSDLTYVNLNGRWNYICMIIDLFNREIVGYSAGKQKSSLLVYQAFSRIKYPLNKINILHTDRGSEFKNELIDNLLNAFSIKRSLSRKGCPYDNAVAEAAYKVVKTEFILQQKFNSLEQLETELFDYVNWYNNHRIHGSLDYMTPVEFRKWFDKKAS